MALRHFSGKILTIARCPDHCTHLGLTSIDKLNHVVVCGSRAWSDVDLPFSQHPLQFQTQHRFWLCFEPSSQAGSAIDFQDAKVIQVPEEAFAQQREWDNVQWMGSSQRPGWPMSQFRRESI